MFKRWLCSGILCSTTVAAAAVDVDGTGAAAETEEGVFRTPEDQEAIATEAADAEDRRGAAHVPMFNLRSRLRSTGSGAGFYQRLEGVVDRRLRLMVQSEKDPGESSPIDFSSFYLHWQQRTLGLVVGDLRPGFGQGLVYARSTRGRRSLSIRRDSNRIGFSSTAENAAIRGVALRRQGGSSLLLVLAGRLAWDGRLEEDRVVAMPASGIHRSATEREGRNIVRAWTAGLRLRTAPGKMAGGVALSGIRFQRVVDLRRTGRTPWSYHGRWQGVGAIDVGYSSRRLSAVAEIGGDRRGRLAALSLLRLRTDRCNIRGQMRHYDAGFHSFFGAAAAATGMQNERGYAVALSGRWRGSKWELSADHHANLQPTSRLPAKMPTDRWTLSVQSRLAGGVWQILLRERRSRLWRGGREQGDSSRKIRVSQRRGGRRLKRWNFRLEAHRGQSESGLLGAVLWRHQRGSLRHILHFSRFATASQVRLYEYEYDLPGAVSIRSLAGNGWRLYVLTGVARQRLRVAVRYRIQTETNRRNFRQEFGLQIDWNA